MRLEPVYGPHPSRCFGSSLGLDPLNFTVKCPLSCAFCPIPVKKSSLKKYSPGELEMLVEESISERELRLETLYIDGSADPFLYDELPELLGKLKSLAGKYGFKLALKTNMYFARALSTVLEAVDLLVVPFYIADLEWSTMYSPAHNLNLSAGEYYSRLASILSEYKSYADKIVFDVYVGRVGLESNLSAYLDEYVHILLYKLRPRKGFIKTLDRPVRNFDLKPVSKSVLGRISEKLVEEGVEAVECSRKSIGVKAKSKRAFIEVYNHIIRKPLRTTEITGLYGDYGIIAIESLVSRKLARKIIWENELFYIPSG
ncbi:hypothetical protein ACSU1N_01050 [Thermogladius sp. 4427co]|uniref:hypothetical protein n=1 Tax=Thermogladius sp. 4427co TaxID=3450718 RepID=UPI003F78F400